jgi:hypothetical protein
MVPQWEYISILESSIEHMFFHVKGQGSKAHGPGLGNDGRGIDRSHNMVVHESFMAWMIWGPMT